VTDVEGVRGQPVRVARMAEPAAGTNAALKQFLRGQVYFSPVLAEERDRSAGMIAELFGHFVRHPERLPESYREGTAGEPLHRVVCDYIAGMTDGFFRRTHEQELG
jgi:dGTPase